MKISDLTLIQENGKFYLECPNTKRRLPITERQYNAINLERALNSPVGDLADSFEHLEMLSDYWKNVGEILFHQKRSNTFISETSNYDSIKDLQLPANRNKVPIAKIVASGTRPIGTHWIYEFYKKQQ